MNGKGWSKTKMWNEVHTQGCPHDGPSTQVSSCNRCQAVALVSRVEFPTKGRSVLLSELVSGVRGEMSNNEEKRMKNSAAHFRRTMGLIRSQEEATFDQCLEGLMEKGYSVKRRGLYTPFGQTFQLTTLR